MRSHDFGGASQWAGGRWDATWEADNGLQHVIVGIKYGLIREGQWFFSSNEGRGRGRRWGVGVPGGWNVCHLCVCVCKPVYHGELERIKEFRTGGCAVRWISPAVLHDEQCHRHTWYLVRGAL